VDLGLASTHEMISDNGALRRAGKTDRPVSGRASGKIP